MIWYLIIGIIERGLIIVGGPGLIYYFGENIGTKLFPVKAFSFFLALVVIPLT